MKKQLSEKLFTDVYQGLGSGVVAVEFRSSLDQRIQTIFPAWFYKANEMELTA